MSLEQTSGTSSQKTFEMLDDIFETSLLDLLYEIEEEGEVRGFSIDEERSGDNDEGTANVAKRINALCQVLEINPSQISEYFLRGFVKNYRYKHKFLQKEMRRAQRHGISIGEFVTQAAWMALPIESDEEGEGFTKIELKSPSGRFLRVNSEGCYETVYPVEDDSEKGSVIIYRIEYNADIVPASLERPVAREEVAD